MKTLKEQLKLLKKIGYNATVIVIFNYLLITQLTVDYFAYNVSHYKNYTQGCYE